MDRVKEFIIPEEISELLEKTAIKTNRSELFYVVEALKNYFSENYDYQIARDRFEDSAEQIITSKEIRERFNL